MKTILVTGGAGFIGSEIARGLINRGMHVVIADNLSTGTMDNVPKGADLVNVDLGAPEGTLQLPDIHFDAILHLAGQSSGEASFKDPWYDFRSHAASTMLLVEYALRKGIPRFLYASSMAIYGNPARLPVVETDPGAPLTYYSAGKLAAEAYVRFGQSAGLATTIFRLFSVYGPGQNLDNKLQGMISIYLSYILEGLPVEVKGGPERFRDFVHVHDVVGAWLACLENPISRGKTYNVCSGRKSTVADVLAALKDAWGDPEYPVRFSGQTPGDQFGVFGSNEKLSKETGWSPQINVHDGIREMVHFYAGRKQR